MLNRILLGLCLSIAFSASAQPVHSVGSIFHPLGESANSVYRLSILTLAVCGGIFVVVGGLLAYAVVRFRHREGDSHAEPPQVYGSNQIEIAWTVIPILIVFVLTMSTARVTSAVQDLRAPADAVKVTVVGHQWWWEFRYPQLGIVSANELHVPLSTKTQPKYTFLTLESADVAHSFWVPQLAGKTDVIPNRTNKMWINASEPGVYLGNCAEYCGTQHANMLIRVIVESQQDFEKWIAAQQPEALGAPAAPGQAIFQSLSCINCHTVRGTPADGKFGPDLTHLMSRQTLASGMTGNNAANLRDWVKDPQRLKPGSLMPDMQLDDRQLDQVVAYLSSLK
jgi:cytochrome c oxidase subunit 2